MRKYFFPPEESWISLCERPLVETEELRDTVVSIIENVCLKGDEALLQYCDKYDGVRPASLKITEKEIQDAPAAVPQSLKDAINIARKNIEKFHLALIGSDQSVVIPTGIECWSKSVPIEKVGLYIPGGTAPLFSTVLMLGIPAKLAGCRDIILCTPPDKNGMINPVILYTAEILGLRNIFKVGGAQAVAAMAFGTQTIPKVYKIFGPGNRYVTKAKELVQRFGVAIDMPAGPSEVLVIAGKEAKPEFVACDLLSQTEHGPDSQAVLLTDSKEMIDKVEAEIEKQLDLLPRKELIRKSLSHSFAVLLPSLDDCIAFSNLYAPEHLVINSPDCRTLADRVTSAGSVFLGEYSCQSAGDYAIGPNHTLPTNGFAHSYSGLTAADFMKQIFFQEVSKEGLAYLAPSIIEMAEAENLKAHSNAIKTRLL